MMSLRQRHFLRLRRCYADAAMLFFVFLQLMLMMFSVLMLSLPLLPLCLLMSCHDDIYTPCLRLATLMLPLDDAADAGCLLLRAVITLLMFDAAAAAA